MAAENGGEGEMDERKTEGSESGGGLNRAVRLVRVALTLCGLYLNIGRGHVFAWDKRDSFLRLKKRLFFIFSCEVCWPALESKYSYGSPLHGLNYF